MKIYVTDFDGVEHELEALEGWRAMEVIRDWKLPIKAECGGCCMCATCHVYVADEWLDKMPEMTYAEQDCLDDAFEVENNSRLSCQIILNEDMDGLKLKMANGTQADGHIV